MKKTMIWIIVALSITALFILPALSQDDEPSVLIDEGFEKRQRPGSLFDHDAHMEYEDIEDCNACHHVYENGKKLADETSEGEACSECHQEKPDDGSTKLISAYHNQCKGCHEELKKGPLTCGECHVK